MSLYFEDYGESHYMAPVRGAQPNSEAWVDGFPHSPWLVLNAYFARAFKEVASLSSRDTIIINQSGRGDKDIFTVADAFGDTEWKEFIRDTARGYDA